MGCHPTSSTEFEKFDGGPSAYLQALDTLLKTSMEEGTRRAVAVGECGLGKLMFLMEPVLLMVSDYDRTRFATPNIQRKYFRK